MNTLKNLPLFVFLCFVSVIISCTPQPFDPEKEIRIFYKTPMGCDEVSGIITLKASVTGENAPVPAQMHYEIRKTMDAEPMIFKGYYPDYEALFDTTSIRDGFVYYRAVPMDEQGTPIDIKASPYHAKGIVPSFKGFMINNGQINLSRPLVIMGAPLEPDVGHIDGDNFKERFADALVFGASLMTHLQLLGFVPEFCFEDRTTVVLDPFNPSTRLRDFPDTPFDLTGQAVEGFVRWKPGNLCYPSPFFETPKPNGIPDMWQYAALDYMMLQQKRGSVTSKPDAIDFFRHTVESLTRDYDIIFDWFSMFELEKPVPGAAPGDIVEEKLKDHILGGATSVLVYDFYNKANEFEMSSGSWPHIQKSVDKANNALDTSLKIGAISTNEFQLMDYDGFYNALFLGVRELVSSSEIPDDATVGIIIAAHGSSTTNRLYDVSNIVNNPVMQERIEDYFRLNSTSIHPSTPDILVCYSEYANSPEDGLRGVGEQVRDWAGENYDVVFVFPMEWAWASMDVWHDLRENAVELIHGGKEDIFKRDERGRSRTVISNTTLIIGETILEQKKTNPSAYHFLRTAATNLLEDRMITLTGSEKPKQLSGEFSVEASVFGYMFTFSETAVLGNGKITFQNSGLRAETTLSDGKYTGAVDRDDFWHYLFFTLVEFGLAPENLSITSADISYRVEETTIRGTIEATAEALVWEIPNKLSITITF